MNFSYGLNCKDVKTSLTEISINDLYEQITSPDHYDLITATKNLRSILKYSQDRYRNMKTSLPFFSCSNFIPQFRKSENFNSAGGLVIDLDFKTALNQELIEKFKNDLNIALGYISPSNMGMKLVIGFDIPITDATTFVNVYKYFSFDFAKRYHLGDSLDQRNCDVSRISFLCHDPNAWIQTDYEPIVWKSYLPELSFTEIEESPIIKDPNEIPASTYKQILNLLGSKPKTKRQTMPLMVEISTILPELTEELDGYGIKITSAESISYGAKIKVSRESDIGEINLYRGKSGYTAVISPRKGTNNELNEATKVIIESVIVNY